MANAWIEFVRKWAKDNNVSYACAVSKPECKAQYHATKKIVMVEKIQEKTPSLLSAKKTSELKNTLTNMKRKKIVIPATFGIGPIAPTTPQAPQILKSSEKKRGRKPKVLRRKVIILDE